MSGPDLSRFSLWDLYRAEVETHSKTLNDGLLALERDPTALGEINSLMRAAHSIKGAARVIQHPLAVEVAHAMEDRLVAVQEGRLSLTSDAIQHLLDGVDLLSRISPANEGAKDERVAEARGQATSLIAALSGQAPPAGGQVGGAPAPAPAPPPLAMPAPVAAAPAAAAPAVPVEASREGGPRGEDEASRRPSQSPEVQRDAARISRPDRAVRITAQTLTRLVALTGEASVTARWLAPFSDGLLGLKKGLTDVSAMLERLEDRLFVLDVGGEIGASINEIEARIEQLRAQVTNRFAALENYTLRQETLHDRLHREVVATRMRPFRDLAEGYPRLVRDLARQLGKRVRLEIDGPDTQVDRDLSEMLDAPLVHLLRNAVDHGIEPPDARRAAGKPEEGRIHVSAFHRGGMLRIRIADDGKGVDIAALRAGIVARQLTDGPTAERLTEQEVLAFLFLPGFSTATRVTDVSGRGVGLDVVQETMKAIGGRIHVANAPGHGLEITFDLPLTLSVLQALIVEIGGEPYAVPLTRIERIAARTLRDIRVVEGREYLTLRTFRSAGGLSVQSSMHDEHVGLVQARQILGIEGALPPGVGVPVVVLRDRDRLYGLVVDRLVGEQFVVVRPLDARLGKVKDISAAALAVDGTPLLVIDVDDLVRSIEQVVIGGRLAPVAHAPQGSGPRRKHVLVVDDSITVREIERQLLEAHGYTVDVAVDGMDGWNAIRTGHYDLVVTDVDMPRLDGIELVRRVRADRQHATLPMMIVSYKDRDEDRLRGLDAGASYYLPKSAFQDDRFLAAIGELIGHPGEP